MLRGVAAALERRGVDGTFDEAPEWPPGVEAPAIGHMLICRLRVRGRRRQSDIGYEWEYDTDAHSAIVSVAERWCKQLGDGASYAMNKSTIGPVPIAFGGDAAEGLLEGPVDNVNTRLVGVAGAAFRQVGVGPQGGDVGLAVGGPAIAEGRWRPPLEELADVLRENSDLLAYGYVRRGWAGGLFTDPSDQDWPVRPESQPRGAGFASEAFQDVFAPDAFPVQVLGAGYASRVPATRSYRQERVGSSAILLQHLDLPAWFDAPCIPYGQRPATGHVPPPPVLAEARRELAPILYTPGALSRSGYADEPDL